MFLADMDSILPWADPVGVVEPVYPKGSELGGRPPMPLEHVLRIYLLQLWFNLSDPAVEEALYDSASMRAFAGIDPGSEGAPDETTICKFRRLLERNKPGKPLPAVVNDYLRRKGKQWYFGMKAHIGVDNRTRLIHTVLASAANVADGLANIVMAGRRLPAT